MLESSSADTKRAQISAPASSTLAGPVRAKANRASRSFIAFWCRASMASISCFISCSLMPVNRLASFAKAICLSRSSTRRSNRLTCARKESSSASEPASERRAASAYSAALAWSFSASDNFMRSMMSLYAVASFRNSSMCSTSRPMRATFSASLAVFSSVSCLNNCSESKSSLRKSSACFDTIAEFACPVCFAGPRSLGEKPSKSFTSPTSSSPVELTWPLISLAAWLTMSEQSSSSMDFNFGALFGRRRFGFNKNGRLFGGGAATSSSCNDCAFNNCNLIDARSRPNFALCSRDSRKESSSIRCSSKSLSPSMFLQVKRLKSRRAAFSSPCKCEISASDSFSLITTFC
mmetsp:Transcript_86348/g.249368  ORF Transcript_86348/g.249368 Transcript_86348/m.249368 type:complete len:349 (+) Transcript_86348:1023-2069(+)